MGNYFLIPMNFLKFNFVELKQEYQRYGKIMWQVPGTPVKGKIDSKAVLPKQLTQGTVIYFYICNIPSKSGKEKARILLRGVVTEEPTVMEYGKVYLTQEGNRDELIIGMGIGELTTLNKEDLENDMCFSLEILRSGYNHQIGQYWASSCNGKLEPELIKALEVCFKKKSSGEDLERLIKHFNKECFFCGKLGTKAAHKTFLRRNGTDYYEGHHFIQQHTAKDRKIEGLKCIIDADENMVWLCSNCHNKLHYGKVNEVNQMIDILWKDDSIQKFLKEHHFEEKIGVDSEEEALKWIKKVYRANEDKETDTI